MVSPLQLLCSLAIGLLYGAIWALGVRPQQEPTPRRREREGMRRSVRVSTEGVPLVKRSAAARGSGHVEESVTTSSEISSLPGVTRGGCASAAPPHAPAGASPLVGCTSANVPTASMGGTKRKGLIVREGERPSPQDVAELEAAHRAINVNALQDRRAVYGEA